MNARHTVSRTAAILWIALLSAVILAQTLGWMHRSVHGVPHLAAPGATATAAPSANSGHAHAHGVERLFAGHGKASDCQLLDASTQADGPPPAAATLAPVPVAALLAVIPIGLIARQALAACARGPPASH